MRWIALIFFAAMLGLITAVVFNSPLIACITVLSEPVLMAAVCVWAEWRPSAERALRSHRGKRRHLAALREAKENAAQIEKLRGTGDVARKAD